MIVAKRHFHITALCRWLFRARRVIHSHLLYKDHHQIEFKSNIDTTWTFEFANNLLLPTHFLCQAVQCTVAKGTSINDVPRFLAIFDLANYLVLLYNVRFCGLSWTHLPTLKADIVFCSLVVWVPMSTTENNRECFSGFNNFHPCWWNRIDINLKINFLKLRKPTLIFGMVDIGTRDEFELKFTNLN